MGGETSFQERWKKNRSWLSHVKGDPSKATCLCCNKQFSVKSGGESSVKTHEGGANHQKLIKEWQSNKQISAGPSKVAEVVIPRRQDLNDRVLCAEVLETINKIDKNQSFKSAG